MPYYAVRAGRVPGIYMTWPECQAQVEKFSGCAHAKFSTREAAEEFVRGTPSVSVVPFSSTSGALSSVPRDHPFAYLSKRELAAEMKALETPFLPREVKKEESTESTESTESAEVFQECFTDGSFAEGRAGGAAVIVAKKHAYLSPVEGAQTNNRGELTGILVALQVTQGSVRVHSDSEWCIRVLTGVYRPTKNLDLIAKVRELSRGRKVEYVKVLAHSGIHYNEVADQLANQARSVSGLTCVKVE